MIGENPYAPPQVAELESHTVYSQNDWKIYANTLIVRCGATLPEIDLENSIREQPLYPIKFSAPSLFNFGNTQSVHSFMTSQTRNARRRRKLQGVLFNINILAMAFGGLYLYSFNFILILFIILMIWGAKDRSKLCIEKSAKAGWLRITNMHPLALESLKRIATHVTHHDKTA